MFGPRQLLSPLGGRTPFTRVPLPHPGPGPGPGPGTGTDQYSMVTFTTISESSAESPLCTRLAVERRRLSDGTTPGSKPHPQPRQRPEQV
eukprot:g39594.t1